MVNLTFENKDAEAALEKATLQLFHSLDWDNLQAENDIYSEFWNLFSYLQHYF